MQQSHALAVLRSDLEAEKSRIAAAAAARVPSPAQEPVLSDLPMSPTTTVGGALTGSGSALRRPSAISLSSLHHRAPFPLRLDLSSVIDRPLGSPVTLAPRTAAPRTAPPVDFAPEFLLPLPEVIDLTLDDPVAPGTLPLAGSAVHPINVDVDMFAVPPSAETGDGLFTPSTPGGSVLPGSEPITTPGGGVNIAVLDALGAGEPTHSAEILEALASVPDAPSGPSASDTDAMLAGIDTATLPDFDLSNIDFSTNMIQLSGMDTMDFDVLGSGAEATKNEET